MNASNANSPKAVINKLEQYGNNLNNQLGSSKSIPSSEKEIIEQNSQNEIKKLYDILVILNKIISENYFLNRVIEQIMLKRYHVDR